MPLYALDTMSPQERLWQPPEERSWLGMPLTSVPTPAFVVREDVARHNCVRMLDTCQGLNLQLRAQTKTHKTIEGVDLQTGGKRRCLVSSTLDECEFFADRGCDDLLFGHPLTAHHLPRVARLTRALHEFHVMVDNEDAVQLLTQAAPPEGKKWSVFLKVDCGNMRAGVWHEDVARGAGLVRQLASSDHALLRGAYAHCGDTYHAPSPEQLARARDDNIERIVQFVRAVERETGVRFPTVGVGSTPSCSNPSPLMKQLTELHPGNYIFYDVQQQLLGSCSEEDIAVAVATRITGHYPRRNQMLIDCGFTGLTKQGWGKMATGYGVIKDHPNLKLSAMNQEHGFLEPVGEEKLDFSRYPVGTLLFILPYHSCATAAQYSQYLVVKDGLVVAQWRPTRGW